MLHDRKGGMIAGRFVWHTLVNAIALWPCLACYGPRRTQVGLRWGATLNAAYQFCCWSAGYCVSDMQDKCPMNELTAWVMLF